MIPSILNKAQLLKVLRRIHLYAGLFMTPWILLYGISGFMFNHPSWFAFGRQAPQQIQLPVHVGAQIEAAQAAQQVLSALNAEKGNDFYQLNSSAPVEFTSPEVSFQVEAKDGRIHRALYRLWSGEVILLPEADLSWPSSFLTRLHTSRTYPDVRAPRDQFTGARAVRAAFVDAMALMMGFWACFGLTMWGLQLKPLRLSGWVVLATTGVTAAAVWSSMYRYFVSIR